MYNLKSSPQKKIKSSPRNCQRDSHFVTSLAPRKEGGEDGRLT